MDVTSTNPLASTGTQSKKTTTTSGDTASGTGKGAAANALTGDFKTFVQLLTAQMENQDPLEPTSNTEFVAQLASFSAVEQQILTNDNLSSILGKLNLGQAGDIAGWIGKDVLVEGAQAVYSGSAVPLEMEPVAEADKAVLLVRNADGTVVGRIKVGPSESQLSWSGKDQTGKVLANGLYSFQVEASKDGVVIGTQDVKAFATVSEVRMGDDGVELIVTGGRSIKADSVSALR
jgi:flagellar basal-body rod modification protein FlgD